MIRVGREAGGPVGPGTKMPRSTLPQFPVEIQFYGFYGPRTIYLPIIMDTPNSIWYWVNSATRARARVMRTRERDN